jgi:hypothetical protein
MCEMSGWVGLLLTAIIGLLTYMLGRYNAKTERLKLRLDLHDRRMKVFQETMDFLIETYKGGKNDMPQLIQLELARRESYFLFGKDIFQFLYEIRKKAVELETAIKNNDAHQAIELRKWISDQCDSAFVIFAKHMSLTE